jgi:signal transduction histidine kinase
MRSPSARSALTLSIRPHERHNSAVSETEGTAGAERRDANRPAAGRRAALSLVLLGLTAAGAVATSIVSWKDQGPSPLPLIVYAGLGALIVQRADNRIGWLFQSIAALVLVTTVGEAFVFRSSLAPSPYPGVAYFGLIQLVVLPPIVAMIVATFALFPSGRSVSARWGLAVWGAAAFATTAVLGQLMIPGPMDVNHAAKLGNPLGGLALAGLGHALTRLSGFGMFACAAAAVISLVVRFRRSSSDERHQIRWLMFVGLIAFVLFLIAALGSSPGGFVSVQVGDTAWICFIGALALGVPIAMTIAILRYRLYDIDVVIKRTVVFGAMAAFITLVYVAVVVGAALILGTEDRNPLLAILATAIVAIAFQPVRDRADHIAGRLVYGDRATPYEVLARFSERVGDTYAAEDVLPTTARIVAEGVAAESATVWLRVGSELRPAASWPGDAGSLPIGPVAVGGDDLPALPGDLAVAVRDRAGLIGALSVSKPRGEPLTPADEHLLEDLASQEGLVLSNAQLTADLEARLAAITRRSAELKASRRRVVAAQDAERRRLERNIHDGAQQHLVALAVKLRLARTMLEREPDRGRALLDEVRAQVDDALENLQALALGIYPPALERDGLAAALRVDVARLGLPVDLRTNLGRYPIETEAAVYFCVLEALQNAAKHARAAAVDVEIAERDGVVWFEVADDGVGFDPSGEGNGTGLAGMRDRLAILGGDAALESAPGRGTTVRGRVPACSPGGLE